MQQDLREFRDCKLGNITVQLSLYAFMIESLFENVVVDEAVAVFCNDDGHSEYAVNRPQDSTITDWLNAYTPQVKQSEYVGELRVVDLADASTRVCTSSSFSCFGPASQARKGTPSSAAARLFGKPICGYKVGSCRFGGRVRGKWLEYRLLLFIFFWLGDHFGPTAGGNLSALFLF